ncbi:MAG: hypothetical protein U9R60_14640 [Bacteroidota bacterium]|nr:hypothetical protein [Bacteroidota bacterium]
MKKYVWGPTIIDTPGLYQTREGHHVRIDRIDDPSKATFNAKGHYYMPKDINKTQKHTWSIWHPDGSFMCKPSHLDIIKKIKEQK